MLFIAKTDTSQYEIEVRETGNNWSVRISNMKTKTQEIFHFPKKNYQQIGEVISFIFNNRSFLIDIVTKGDDYTIFTSGSHKNIQILTEEKVFYNNLSKTSNATNEVRSEMPGKIIHIPVKKGDVVQRGDLLLVISAMKMENEIRAKTAGFINKVHVEENQNVETGVILLSIK